MKKEESGEEVGTKERKEFLSAHSLSFKNGTWASVLPWKERLLLHMVGSKDGLSESRHILPPSSSGRWYTVVMSGFGSQSTLALNARLSFHRAL